MASDEVGDVSCCGGCGAGGALGTDPVARDAGSGAVPQFVQVAGGLGGGLLTAWLASAPILGAQKLFVPPCTTKYSGPHSHEQLIGPVVPLLV